MENGFSRVAGRTVCIASRKSQLLIAFRYWLVNCLIVITLSVGLSAVGAMLSDVLDINNFKRYVQAPLLFALNALPLTLIMLMLYHLTSRTWVAFSLGGGLYLTLLIINRFKMQLREEPLTLPDFQLGLEAANVIKISELPVGLLEMISCLIWLALSILLFTAIKSKRLYWIIRIVGVGITAALLILFFNTYCKDTKLYDKFEIRGSQYSRVNQFKSRGFVYSFLVQAGSYRSIRPEGYSKEEARQILELYRNTNDPAGINTDDPASRPVNSTTGKLPHVIAVMGESFYDIDRIDGVKLNEGYDPLENFRRISGQARAGRIVTDVYGGGTANTEFAFLTGHSLSLMPDIGSPYISHLRKDTYSLARVFERQGYSTLAFHPGDSWFYNRANVYRFFGFDSIFFKDSMDLKSVKTTHGYISDRDTADFAVSKLKVHMAEKPGVPLFEFIVDIDNHGPYSKVDLGYPEMLDRGSMEPKAYNTLNNYINGLARCDQALGHLTGLLDDISEPVVLLFFGDHLPNLGLDYLGYKALDFPIGQTGDLESYLNQYETPWFIWSNQAARVQLTEKGSDLTAGTTSEISANYLAIELLQYVGMDGGAYLDYLEDLKKVMPVITRRFTMYGGAYMEKLPKDAAQLLDRYRKLQYFMMMEQEVNTN